MARTPRLESATGIHHVMNRGVDHQLIFRSDEDRLEFGRQLAWMHEHLDVTTLAYCLMDNHYHVLLRAPDGTLSEAMHRLGSVYARRANDAIGRDGPLFRGRFRSIPVETEPYLLWAARYVHRNALDLPGVESVCGHRWSSYRAYLGLRPVPNFVDVGPVMECFGNDAARLAAFTERNDDAVTAADGGELVATVASLVACAISVADLCGGGSDRALRSVERTVVTLLSRRAPDPAVREALAEVVRRPSSNATRMAIQRAEHRLKADAGVAEVLAWVLARLPAVSVLSG